MKYNEAHILECRNVSNIQTLSPSKWYNKLYSPSVSAEFLKDISIIACSGEIHGVVGNPGCGKTTLLRLIAGRCAGQSTGEIVLNHRPLHHSLFDSVCAYVDFDSCLVASLTIKSHLQYQADLTICGLSTKEKQERISLLMREFDLMQYRNVTVSKLSKSARRRLIVCMQLIRDPGQPFFPKLCATFVVTVYVISFASILIIKELNQFVLILLDEPTRDLDALSSYQLMYSLSLYIKRTQRMALITMQCPRSDLYQLLSRITILFYGETVYSGYAKDLPHYFRQIGYPCPITENPAVYYLSLATIDRETTDRYRETQEQAIKLIRIFKDTTDGISYQPTIEQLRSTITFHHPICYFGRPNCLHKLVVLTRRSFNSLLLTKQFLILRLLLLPILIFLFTLSIDQTAITNWRTPNNLAAILLIYASIFSIVSVILTAIAENVILKQSRFEIAETAYHEFLAITSLLLASIPCDLITFALSVTVIFWFCEALSSDWSVMTFLVPLWSCYQYAQLLTLIIGTWAVNASRTMKLLIPFTLFMIVCSGSFFVVPNTFVFTADWRHTVLYANFYRYALAYLNIRYITSVESSGCTSENRLQGSKPFLRNFCRWTNGTVYLSEIYPDFWTYKDGSFNYICMLMSLSLIATIAILFCSLNKRSQKSIIIDERR